MRLLWTRTKNDRRKTLEESLKLDTARQKAGSKTRTRWMKKIEEALDRRSVT